MCIFLLKMGATAKASTHNQHSDVLITADTESDIELQADRLDVEKRVELKQHLSKESASVESGRDALTGRNNASGDYVQKVKAGTNDVEKVKAGTEVVKEVKAGTVVEEKEQEDLSEIEETDVPERTVIVSSSSEDEENDSSGRGNRIAGKCHVVMEKVDQVGHIDNTVCDSGNIDGSVTTTSELLEDTDKGKASEQSQQLAMDAVAKETVSEKQNNEVDFNERAIMEHKEGQEVVEEQPTVRSDEDTSSVDDKIIETSNSDLVRQYKSLREVSITLLQLLQ